ncbi:MAG: RpiB/LacA/LacB family sugar-phosphate isomerase, partial [Candidatus Portnoybacteria bacterium]|nr:RpiB/LacA/LacB family sugar-phosphate isomerase [Candidatus Portnoybacteria bacterium]
MIYLGADHAGFHLKEELKEYLKELGYEYEDLGNQQLEPKDDYPDFALAVAEKVTAT